jgi:hypothetical protein
MMTNVTAISAAAIRMQIPVSIPWIAISSRNRAGSQDPHERADHSGCADEWPVIPDMARPNVRARDLLA